MARAKQKAGTTHNRSNEAIGEIDLAPVASSGSVIWDFTKKRWMPDPTSSSTEVAEQLQALASQALITELASVDGPGRLQFALQMKVKPKESYPVGEITEACRLLFHQALGAIDGAPAPTQSGHNGWFTLRVTFLDRGSNVGHREPRLRQPKLPTQAELESEIEGFHATFVPKLHAWLATLSDRRFETMDEAQSEINALVALVRRAGRQLLYEGQPATIAPVLGTRQKRPSIQLRGRHEGQRKILLSSVQFPLLSTGPAE